VTRYEYYECGQCGDIGKLSVLKDHPTRPGPMDIGFCPECGSEIEEPLTESECRALLESYDEDFDKFFPPTP